MPHRTLRTAGWLFAIAALFTAVPASAQPPAAAPARPSAVGAGSDLVQFGARSLHIPRPQGFEPIAALAPKYMQLMQAYIPDGLLEIYTTPADAKVFAAGQVGDLARSFQLEVVPQLDGVAISEKDFQALSKQIEAQMGPVVPEAQKAVDAQNQQFNAAIKSKSGIDPDIAISGAQYLGVYRREPWGTFFTLTYKTGTGANQVQMVNSTAFVLINQRAVNLLSYAVFRDESDRKWAEQAASAWADAVHRANSNTHLRH